MQINNRLNKNMRSNSDPLNQMSLPEVLHILARFKDSTFNQDELIKRAIECIQEGEGGCFRDHQGNSSMHYAARIGNPDIIDVLLDKGVDINAENREMCTPLQQALYELSHMEQDDENQRYAYVTGAKYLIEMGASVNAKELHYAAVVGEPSLIDALLLRGLDIDAVDDISGYSPLLYALDVFALFVANPDQRKQRIIGAKYLIEKGANINIEKQNEHNNSIMHCAALAVDPDLVDMLLSKGVDIDAVNRDKETPLLFVLYKLSVLPDTHVFLRKIYVSSAKYLIKKGANVNAVCAFKDTPLGLARDAKETELECDLLAAGAKLEITAAYDDAGQAASNR